MELSGITQFLINMVINPLMWLLLIIGVLVACIGILYIRRRRRFLYPVIEIVDIGSGKTNLNSDLKAGYIGKRIYLGGLWWTGEQVLRTNLNDIIEYFSTEDFQEVNGQRGVVCFRDPIRRNILFPISRLELKNKELIASVAPADYTDVAVSIVEDASREVSDWKDKLIQFGSWALVIIFSLIAIIVITQMVKNGQEKSAELLLNAGKEGAQACRSVCTEALSVVLSKGGTVAGTIISTAP